LMLCTFFVRKKQSNYDICFKIAHFVSKYENVYV
jgi:hypothetical protein